MNTQSFVDELNFYSQLEFDEDYWTLEAGKLKIKQDSANENSGIDKVNVDSSTIIGVYSLRGYKVANGIEDLSPGIYIIKTQKSVKKIIVK